MTWLLLSALWLTAGCSAIDDDLSDCGVDYEIQYELQLVTNMEMELQTQLTTQVETSVAAALREHLKDIFSDFARDIDLSFYDVDEQLGRLSHEQHVMNNNEKSYTLYLPMREYRHLALANLQQNSWVTLTGEEHSNTMMLQQVLNEPVESHQTGIFAARTNLDVLENQSQTFHVNLYMVNCAAVLLLESRGHDAKDVSVVSTGFATGYNVDDNTYTFSDNPPLVNAGEEVYWQFRVYVKNGDNIVETVMNIKEPLKAGELRIIKGYIDSDGAVRPYDSKVGVSVTLDWNGGANYETPL